MPNAIAVPTSLADLVEYADGSVASRVILRNNGGTMTVRLETGQALHLPATVPHEVVGGEPFKMLLTLLRTSHDD